MSALVGKTAPYLLISILWDKRIRVAAEACERWALADTWIEQLRKDVHRHRLLMVAVETFQVNDGFPGLFVHPYPKVITHQPNPSIPRKSESARLRPICVPHLYSVGSYPNAFLRPFAHIVSLDILSMSTLLIALQVKRCGLPRNMRFKKRARKHDYKGTSGKEGSTLTTSDSAWAPWASSRRQSGPSRSPRSPGAKTGDKSRKQGYFFENGICY